MAMLYSNRVAQLVGILNITPDSFSDGGQFVEPKKAVAQAVKLFQDGAILVDIGAESTRPGAVALDWHEEWARLEPVLMELEKQFPGWLSVDTHHPETVEKVLAIRNDIIINDVTGMNNPAMVRVVSNHNARCIISHLIGADIQAAHNGELEDANIIRDDLYNRAQLLESKGVDHEHIILDPGIGFGKTPELNRRLLTFPNLITDYPVMIGYSRKRFLGEHRMELESNLEAGRIAAQAGAAYLRVHDVAGHRSLLTTGSDIR
jgi:dihydropteroate synthase